MPVTTTVRFDPLRLRSAIISAFPASVKVAVLDAKANSPSRKAGATGRATSTTVGYIKPTGLGHIFEKGRKGGYEINPGGAIGVRRSRSRGATVYKARYGSGSNTALKFPDGGYSAYAIGGPMPAKPYVGPAGLRWARGGYQMTARRILLTRGFR